MHFLGKRDWHLKISWELAQALLYQLSIRIAKLITSQLLIKDRDSSLSLSVTETQLHIHATLVITSSFS